MTGTGNHKSKPAHASTRGLKRHRSSQGVDFDRNRNSWADGTDIFNDLAATQYDGGSHQARSEHILEPSSIVDTRTSPSTSRRVNAPRKRSIYACNFCRVRKAKCDNTRPSCGFCLRYQVTCVYADDNTDQKHLFDPASLQIMDSIGELKELLANAHSSLDAKLQTILAPSEPAQQEVVTSARLVDCSVKRAEDVHVTSDVHFATSPEAMLRWPAFRGVLRPEDQRIQSFLLDSSIDLDFSDPAQFPAPHAAIDHQSEIRGHEVVRLCRHYLAHVHTRNPVLDEDVFMDYAKEVAENGPACNAQTCLVLLATAIAALTAPFEATDSSPVTPRSIRASDRDEVKIAEHYFEAAKMHMGLLESRTIDIQCLFLSVTYEKCCLRPLRAWQYLEQACSKLQSYISRRRRRAELHGNEDLVMEPVVQRLFISCVKAECEFMSEFPLRPTGILQFPYPVAFPPPPNVPNPPENETRFGSMLCDYKISADERERSWFFYLAEISVRRTIMDTVEILYPSDELDSWCELPSLLRNYDHCEEKFHLWHAHLPSSMKFHDDEVPSNQLVYYLKGRFQLWRDIISRPLLYHVIHNDTGTDETLASPDFDRARAIAQECVTTSAAFINQCQSGHRHGGTWMTCRALFALALIILASALHADQVEPPSDWKDTIKAALCMLRRWAPEAEDVEWMRDVLLHAFNATCDKLGIHLPEDFWVDV